MPVLVAEVLEVLRPRSGWRHADGTLGGGGHAEAVLQASAPDGWLGGCDRDGMAVAFAKKRLACFGTRCEVRRQSYSELGEWIKKDSVDSVLLDLGVSSPQLDTAERGFSFQHDGPLDMRMDDRKSLTAAELVNGAEESKLANWFWEMGGERQSRRVARAIVNARASNSLETTRELAAVVERALPRRGRRLHPATRTFQALRMIVNDELSLLEQGLQVSSEILKSGGRLAVITFHSVEARTVKKFGDEHVRGNGLPSLRWVHRRVIKPSEEELTTNPRARSAQLRVLEKE